jgi:hypothetical protein
MSIAVGGSVGFVRIFGVTDGLQITAGSLGSFSPGNDVSRVGISIAGKIRNLNIHGNFGQPVLDPGTGTYIPDSYISASGPSGIIQNLEVFGSLFGNVTATGEIVHMLVAGDVTGSITAQGTSTPLGLGVLHVTGAIKQGALSITGNVNAIIINGGLGIPSGTLTVNGNANSISVGADHHQTGSLLRLNLDVTGRLGSLSMYGAINGNVTTGGDLGKLTVQGDGINKNVITGAISVGGRLGTANIINGNISGSVTAGGSIGSFTISRGDLLAGGTVQSLIDTIRSFNITGGLSYGLFGSLIEPSGLRSNINVSGNIGDGTDAAAVTAGSGNVFHVSGSILANASVSTTFGLSQLLVDGNIASGATIIAHPLVKIRVKGSNQGTITQD